jgi:AcrR family transcriptional regulator
MTGAPDPASAPGTPAATGSPAPAATEGRRARQRRELLAAIEAEARRLLEEGGAGNVSMRAIARAVGLGPASLYTYFDSLDDIFTLLLLSSYESLAAATAAAVEAFAGAPPVDRAFAGILAHRRWALAHRNEFNLLFTDILPGYAAPPGGPTIDAQVQVFRPIADTLTELGPDELDLTVEQAGIVMWCAFHGAVALEVNHHLDWVDDPAAAHETTVRRALAGIGAPAPAKTLRRRFDRWAAKA